MAYPDLRKFDALIRRYPPKPANRQERRRIMEMVNPIARRRDMGAGYEPLADYYRKRVDKVIRELRTSRVTRGVMIWKLHSSGVVFKTPKTTFAFDLIDCVTRLKGGNETFGRPDTTGRPVEERPDTKMRMTPRQRQALAELVEYSFYTHGHCDHAGWDLAQRIVAAGNKVIVPPRLQADWGWDEPFARQLLVPEHTDSLASVPPVRRIGPLGVRLHRGFQIHSGGGCRQCNAYLVTTDNGVNILNKGDSSDTGYARWLERLHAYGIELDLWIGNIIYGGSSEEIARLFDCFMIPGHDYDMIHGPYVRGTERWKAGPWGGLYDHYDWHMVRDRAEHIIWGERYHFVPRSDLPDGALALTTVREEVAGFRCDGVTGYFGRGQDTTDSTDGSECRWRGRTLQMRPPHKAGRPSSVFAIYPVDLKGLGDRPVLKVGLALAQQRGKRRRGNTAFRVRISTGWDDEGCLIREHSPLSEEPKHLQTSLARYASRSVHVILETESTGSSEPPPSAWLLNPHIVRGSAT